jgi:isopenicillin-N epimerase
MKIAALPLPFRTADETVDALRAASTPRTRLVVVSHITSPTAVILPIAEICRWARQADIAVAIDGPHAVAHVPLSIDALDCGFYAASCHKWLSAPFGAGFLYVAPRFQAQVRPPQISWGRLLPGEIQTWSDEFIWSGTRDPSAYLSIPAAIDFLTDIGLVGFRARTHALAAYARRRLVDLCGLEPMTPDDPAWYGSMAHVPLPAAARGNRPGSQAEAGHINEHRDRSCPTGNPLQGRLWRDFHIEAPVVEFHGQRYLRVSCHLYNDRSQIDQLVDAVKKLLSAGE